ncbi:MAG: hypothetical protein ACOH1H_04765 [Brevundimonas sp.]
MIALALAALLAATVPQAVPSPPALQTPASPAAATGEVPVLLEDIEVTGRPLDALINGFVNEVAAPNRHRGIARWQDEICVGAANLRADVAQYLVDRVSTVAEDLGLRAGGPGCAANVLIIASADPDGLARQLTGERSRAFRMGGSGMDRGSGALRAFVTSDRPVRWWQVAMPVDSETGDRAVRIPGDCRNACMDPQDAAPVISVSSASRLSTQIVDNLFRTVVILDVDQVSRVSAQQLADYVAMVTLAQIDPEADTRAYASVLNVFDDPGTADGLTDWDLAYLQGLYDAERNRQNLRAGRAEIAESIHRAHAAADDDDQAETPAPAD